MKKILTIRITGILILAIITFFLTTKPDNDTRVIVGIIISLPAIIMLLVALFHLGKKAFAVKAIAKELVTKGFYSKIQHPLYIFLDIFLSGIIIILGMPMLIILWLVLVSAHLIASEHEEKILAAGFGQKYYEYREKTWF